MKLKEFIPLLDLMNALVEAENEERERIKSAKKFLKGISSKVFNRDPCEDFLFLSKAFIYGSEDDCMLVLDKVTDSTLNTFHEPEMILQIEKQGPLLISSDSTFLHLAIQREMYEVAKVLIYRLNDYAINKANEDGITALILALSEEQEEISKLLLQRTSPEAINAVDKNGMTALSFAALKGYSDICKLLIEKMTHEKIAYANREGFTALSLAAHNKHTEICKLLIQKMDNAGISTFKEGFGITALETAIIGQQEEICLLLIPRMSSESINVCNRFKMTSLNSAIKYGMTEVCKALIPKMTLNAIINPNKNGNTPLDIMKQVGNTEIAKLIEDRMIALDESSKEALNLESLIINDMAENSPGLSPSTESTEVIGLEQGVQLTGSENIDLT